MYFTRTAFGVLCAALAPLLSFGAAWANAPQLVSVRRIWDAGEHNAFTDLIRFKEQWWCTFREAGGHGGGTIGKVRVIRSVDGETWESAALLDEDGIDLRDPKLSVMPDGRLMLLAGGSVYQGTEYLTRAPRVAFSADGRNWTPPRKLLAEDHWLWRATWHKGRAYSLSKMAEGRDPRRGFLYASADGIDWQWLDEWKIDGVSETTIRFMPDDEAIALIRPGWIGRSRPPYSDWSFHKMKLRLGGPNFIRLPDGSLWASARRYGDSGATTVLARMAPNRYTPLLTLPSGGDTSYPGLVWHDGLLWMSYYSSHEGKTSIYLAKIRFTPLKERRILYNLDGDSCMWTRAGAKEPVAVSVDDLKRVVHEISSTDSHVDTMLVCINAQVMYYPTSVGTLRGTQSTDAERDAWPAHERQRYKNMSAFFAAGVDPYAIILAEAKKYGMEALLTFRMNDDHGNDFLRTRFWYEHPGYRLGRGALDFSHAAVREHVFQLITEAVCRYDCDGIELDFQRFPAFFSRGSSEERVAKLNALVERVRGLLDEEGAKRQRQLVLAARVPSEFGKSPPSYDAALRIGCDPVAWAKNGWVDFLTVSEFFLQRYDLPIAPWKNLLTDVPIYGGIECTENGKIETWLTAEKYRRAAEHLWRDGADGIYLFNFFTSREFHAKAFEPPFEVLSELGDRAAMLAR